MQVSRACGAEVFSCTRTPLVSPTQESTKTRKALPFAFVSAAPPFLVRLPALLASRSRTASSAEDSRPQDQIWERDWQPSTGTLAPLIQLARGDTRNATTAPTSSGRPKRPNGSSCMHEIGDPGRIVLLTAMPRSAGKQNRPRRHAVDADVVARQLLRQRLRQADFGGLHRVVRHPAAGLPAPDRRNHHDRPAAAAPHVRHGQPRRADGRKQRLIDAPRAIPRLSCQRSSSPGPGRRC